MPSLFARKIHAILCRGWSRVKGRDLYDYIFYLSRNTKVNIPNLKAKLVDSGVLCENAEFSIETLVSLLIEKFMSIDYQQAKVDVKPFIKNTASIDIWDADFFTSATQQYLSN